MNAIQPGRAEPERPSSCNAFWIPLAQDAMAAWLHSPPTSSLRTSAVLVCPPFGHEYTHSHRAMVHLATSLADHGFLTLRIDYPGTGDSTGTEATPGLVDLWLRGLEEAAGRLESLVGEGHVTLIGCRLGAALAGTVATRRDVRHFVAWNPVVRGSRFIREQQAVRLLSGDVRDASAEGPPGFLDIAGFRMSTETVEATKALDLLGAEYRITGSALVVERDDLAPDGRLSAHLSASGVDTEVIGQSDYLDMVAEPQYAKVPHATIGDICSWLAARDQEGAISLDEDAHYELRSEQATGFLGMTEELVTIPGEGGSELFGVLCSPIAGPHHQPPVVVMPNSGSVHHIGPGRLYVEAARALAQEGISSLRFDLRNLGDSCIGPCPQENHPYPSTAVEDVRRAVEWLISERHFGRAILAGLCSGAHTAYRAGVELEASPITGVVAINPLTFEWKDGMSLDTPDSYRNTRDAKYYGAAVRDRARWLKLLRGQSDVGYIVRFLVTRVAQRMRDLVRNVLGSLGLRRKRSLERDLTTIKRTGRRVHFVFSSSDPGYDILMSEAQPVVKDLVKAGTVGLSVVPDADHTFSKKPWREAAIAAILFHVGSLIAVPRSSSK